MGSGLLHLAAASQHVGHRNVVVGFFLVVAGGQVAAALWLFVNSLPAVRPPPRVLAAGLGATVALIGLYLVAHRTELLAGFTSEGLPAGHDHTGGPGHPVETGGAVALGDEPVIVPPGPDLLGMATLVLETLTVVALTALVPRAWRTRVVDILCAVGALTWLLWLTGVLG